MSTADGAKAYRDKHPKRKLSPEEEAPKAPRVINVGGLPYTLPEEGAEGTEASVERGRQAWLKRQGPKTVVETGTRESDNVL